jgi:hypothetical protein
VTPVGHELFGLNHDTFAAGRSVLSDVSRIVFDGLRPPDARLPVEIRGMPEGSRGGLLDYVYDTNSALNARTSFLRLKSVIPWVTRRTPLSHHKTPASLANPRTMSGFGFLVPVTPEFLHCSVILG